MPKNKNKRYLIYRTDGTCEEVWRSDLFRLDELQATVDGSIEGLKCPKRGTYIFFNEEGRLRDLPVNPFFTNRPDEQEIVGDVVEGTINQKGDFMGVPQFLKVRRKFEK